MRDDLKEELMGYARAAADQASPPGAAVIRRHARRVVALTVTGVLVAVGLGVGSVCAATTPPRPSTSRR